MHDALRPLSILIILSCAWAGQRNRFIVWSVIYPTRSTLLDRTTLPLHNADCNLPYQIKVTGQDNVAASSCGL
jgi:hypothetical protein